MLIFFLSSRIISDLPPLTICLIDFLRNYSESQFRVTAASVFLMEVCVCVSVSVSVSDAFPPWLPVMAPELRHPLRLSLATYSR